MSVCVCERAQTPTTHPVATVVAVFRADHRLSGVVGILNGANRRSRGSKSNHRKLHCERDRDAVCVCVCVCVKKRRRCERGVSERRRRGGGLGERERAEGRRGVRDETSLQAERRRSSRVHYDARLAAKLKRESAACGGRFGQSGSGEGGRERQR